MYFRIYSWSKFSHNPGNNTAQVKRLKHQTTVKHFLQAFFNFWKSWISFEIFWKGWFPSGRFSDQNLTRSDLACFVLHFFKDALSSILVARDGFGDMAVSNAIGSNVFDINLGIGLPFVIRGLIDNFEAIHLLSKEEEVGIWICVFTKICDALQQLRDKNQHAL